MVVFGMGLLNGAKMSSSKGNVYLLEDAINDFGADTVRMFLIGSGEPWQDFDWRNELVSSTKKQIERFAQTIREGLASDGPDTDIDRWLISRMQNHISLVTTAMENFQTRQALQEAFFGFESDLKWYKRRLGQNPPGKTAMKTLCSTWVRLLAPIIPFTCEDLWKEIGDGLVSFAPWPESDTAKMDDPAEIAEELLVRTVEDIESILRILKTPPRKVTICVAPSWKWDILTLIAGAPDKKNVIRDVMQKEDIKTRGREAADAVKQCTNLFHKLPSDLVDRIVSQKPDELAIFKGASAFLVDDTKLEIEVVPADACHHMKAGSALPFKPAIIIE